MSAGGADICSDSWLVPSFANRRSAADVEVHPLSGLEVGQTFVDVPGDLVVDRGGWQCRRLPSKLEGLYFSTQGRAAETSGRSCSKIIFVKLGFFNKIFWLEEVANKKSRRLIFPPKKRFSKIFSKKKKCSNPPKT